MNNDGWTLERIADFFYLLVDLKSSGKDILQKRFKKDPVSHRLLFELIKQLDTLGYQNAIEFAFSSNRFDTIKGTQLSLIEIRRIGKTWRVVAYWSTQNKLFVLLDAFEAHKHKSMADEIKQTEPLARIAISLLGEGK